MTAAPIYPRTAMIATTGPGFAVCMGDAAFVCREAVPVAVSENSSEFCTFVGVMVGTTTNKCVIVLKLPFGRVTVLVDKAYVKGDVAVGSAEVTTSDAPNAGGFTSDVGVSEDDV